MAKYHLVHADCSLSGIQGLSTSIATDLLCLWVINSDQCIDCSPLHGRCLLLGVLVNGGSTVYTCM